MPWLVVTGRGSWNHAGIPYAPGTHQISQEVAEAASGSRIRSLFVTEFEPEIMRTPDAQEPLSLDDIRVGTREKVEAHPSAPPVEVESAASGRVFDFPCPYCEVKLAHSGSRDRHIEFHHELVT